MQKRDGTKRITILLMALLLSVTTAIAPFSNVANADVLPGELKTILNKGISRLDPEYEDCIEVEPDGNQVTWIGDSLSVSAKAKIDSRLSGADLYAQNGKELGIPSDETEAQDPKVAAEDQTDNPTGISILKWLADEESLRDYVVLALGTHHTVDIDANTIDAVQEIIGEDRILILVTNFHLGSDEEYTVNNNAILEASNSSSQIIVADWYEAASKKNVGDPPTNEYINDGKVRLTDSGTDAFVSTIYDAISSAWISNEGGSSVGTDDIMSAKNAHATRMDLDDGTDYETIVELFGDLAARTANKYNLSATGLLAHGILESHFYNGTGPPVNNFWYMMPGSSSVTVSNGGTSSDGKWMAFDTIGEGFEGYGQFVHNGLYDDVIGVSDPLEYMTLMMGGLWCVPSDGADMCYGIQAIKSVIEGINATGYTGNASANFCPIGGDFLDDSTFVFYNQCDPEWGSLSYGTGTMCSASCGITSFAMAATALLGQSITPVNTREVMLDLNQNSGVSLSQNTDSAGFVPQMAERYGLKSEVIELSIESVNSALKQGRIVHLSGAGSNPFSTGGHYLIIRGVLPNGNWKIGDSGTSSNNTLEWNPADIASSGWHYRPVAIWK